MRFWYLVIVGVLSACAPAEDRTFAGLDAGAAGTGGASQGGTAGGGPAGAAGTAGTGESGGTAGAAAAAGQGGKAGAAGASGATCDLGTPDHCGACDQPCPGDDDKGTRRTCSDDSPTATCDIVCLGNYYDLDGALDTGCEALDEPDQASMTDAVAILLPDTVDPSGTSNPLNLVAFAYGDDRLHEPSPENRPYGTPDWWAITANGEGEDGTGMVACLGVVSFPADARFEVCISDIGETTFESSGCAEAVGKGASVCVSPPALTDAGDPYYVRVRQVAGSRSPNGYALYLKH